MRDGVRLATDVYLPDSAAPLPAVLVRLPYDKNSRYVFFEQIAELFTGRGYALVVQDVRGKFRSGGHTVPFLTESADGYDTLDWIVRQPWSDGVVGMFGDSYFGYTQWAAVAGEHPALRAIVPRMTCHDLAGTVTPSYSDDPVRPVKWIEGIEYFAHHWVDNNSYDYRPDRELRPVSEQFEEAFTAIGARSAWFDMLVPRRVPLTTPLGKHPFDARPVPVLHCAGWFDNVAGWQLRDYLELASRPGWDAVQYLWAGAVDHENYSVDQAPVAQKDDHNADPAALARMLPGYAGPALDFFDVFLKGVKPVSSLAKVSWELAHGGWSTAPTWPPPRTRSHVLNLTGTQELAQARPDQESLATWLHDPDDLVPSAVPDSFAFLHTYPDEAGTIARADTLTFTAAARTEALDLAGPVSLRVTVSSTAPVFDVFAKLLDLAPDGTARMIVRGQVTVQRATNPVDIDLGHTGYRLRPGHRLALLITGSDYPLYLPATGTEENPWTAATAKASTQTLHTGGTSDAYLTLTVLEG